jgi:hypothetical protein
MPWDISESRKNKRRVDHWWVKPLSHKQGCNGKHLGWSGVVFAERRRTRHCGATVGRFSADGVFKGRLDTAFSDTFFFREAPPPGSKGPMTLLLLEH